ncbi:MAG: hypothetical protein JWO20_1924 [Candidatus Angelobacter sp.]|nr:hypothetical protein [Candidatus Angelobacter sp.]
MLPEQIVDAYFRYHQKHDKADEWAWEKVDDLVRADPDEGWRITFMLVNKAETDEALAYVAAGPLEDLLKNHGLTVIDRIEEESRKNARLHLALSGVWGLKTLPVYDRWYALMQKYGYTDGRRKAL